MVAEYIYTVKDRESGEILFRGGVRDCSDFLGCSYSHVYAMATTEYAYKAETKYSMYKVERHCDGEPQIGGARRKDIVCIDCGILVKDAGANRKRCPECEARQRREQVKQRMREIRESNASTIASPDVEQKRQEMQRNCIGCVYYGGGIYLRTCNYIFMEDKMRGCDATKCTRKKEKHYESER